MTEPCASRTTWLRKSGATAVAAALLLGSMPMGTAVAQTASAARFRGEPVTLNFVNAEIEGVARAMSAILRQQFVVDPRVRGTITLYSEEPLSPRDAYFNFLAALRGLGFTVVEVNGLYKVVPEADAKLQTGTVDVGSTGRRGDQILTQIFRLNHENANNLVPVLRPLISPNNTINANPGNNTLVITDYADNLQRIGKIIAAMDVPASGDVEVIPLRYAVASDIAPMIQRLTESSPGRRRLGPAAGRRGDARGAVDPGRRAQQLADRAQPESGADVEHPRADRQARHAAARLGDERQHLGRAPEERRRDQARDGAARRLQRRQRRRRRRRQRRRHIDADAAARRQSGRHRRHREHRRVNARRRRRSRRRRRRRPAASSRPIRRPTR